MTAIPDEDLCRYTERIKNKSVVITGAGSGIGRVTAKLFARHGAKVIVADRDLSTAERTAEQIRDAAGQAISCKCDVVVWDELVAMFDLAMNEFGSVDIVVANAGVGEPGRPLDAFSSDGRPIKPLTTTIDVNLTGVLYTVHLAQHYLQLNRSSDPTSLKAVVMLASWLGLVGGPVYTATKHAVLGVMRSLDSSFASRDIRLTTIHPWFADTAIINGVRVLLAGLPLTPVPRIAGAIFYAASHPDPSTSGASYWIPDSGPTFMISRENFRLGVYDVIDEKSNARSPELMGHRYYLRWYSTMARIVWKPLLATVGLAAFTALLVRWRYAIVRRMLAYRR